MNSDDVDAIAALRDPVRRAVYEYATGEGRDVGRNEVAEAVGVQRTLAAHHLDKLVAAGLLDTGFRPPAKGGPGSGRPAKVYRRAGRDWAVSVPPRDYRTLALVLAELVAALGEDERAGDAARRTGRRLAEPDAGITENLRRRGYEPYAESGRTRMRNCPFHALSEEQPVLVCSMNLELCRGMAEELGEDAGRVVLDARPGECCVVVEDPESKNNSD